MMMRAVLFLLILTGFYLWPGGALPQAHAIDSLPPVVETPAALSSASSSPVSATIKGQVQKLNGKYLISPGDTLTVNLYDAPEFNQDNLLVRPDGFVTIHPLGEVEVAGTDVDGLKMLLEEKLAYYLKNPRVSVGVQKFHPAIVYVLGAVQRPGPYEIHGDIERPDSTSAVLARGRLTVSNLLANAGGVLPHADLHQVRITHNGTRETENVDMLAMLRNGDTAQDKVLYSGDTIFVPSMPTAMDDETFRMVSRSSLANGNITVRVLGKVSSPGVYTLSAQNPGVNSAVAAAKGFILEAKNHQVKVYRMDPNGKLAATTLNPYEHDYVLRDNDVVVVDERGVPIAGRAFDFADRIIRPFLTVGNFTNSVLDIFDPGRRFPFANGR